MSLSAILDTFSDEKAVVISEDGKYVEKSKEGVSLKGVLQRGRLKLAKDRAPYRVGLTFRPSSITWNYCRRLKVAQLAGKVDLYDTAKKPSEQLTMDIGSAIHELIQNYFWDVGILKGSFKCLKCEKIYHDLVSPTHCPKGGPTHTKKRMVYKEIIMRNNEYLVSGRCDGILVIDDEEHLMDIKSIKNRTVKSSDREFCFEDLEDGPKPDHVVQLMLYMWISGIHHGHLLYVGKNNSQIRTFYIPYDYSVIKPYIDEITYIRDLAKSLQNGEKPELPVPCGRADCLCHEVV